MQVTKEYAHYIIQSPYMEHKTIKKSKRMMNTKHRMVATSVGKGPGRKWRRAYEESQGNGHALLLKCPAVYSDTSNSTDTLYTALL